MGGPPVLGAGVRLEVDTLRAMVIDVEWTDQAQHIAALSLAADLVAGFLRLGHRPVIVVDTFSGDKLARFLADIEVRRPGVDARAFALAPAPGVLRARVEGRPEAQFRDLRICQKLNADTVRCLQPGEQLIDNSALTPEETATRILASCACQGAPPPG